LVGGSLTDVLGVGAPGSLAPGPLSGRPVIPVP